MKLLQASPDRQELPNEALLRTGIAPLSHLSYDKQLAFKQQQVENVLAKIAKLPEIKVKAPIGMEKPFGYRNKAQIPVQKIHGKLTTGFYRKTAILWYRSKTFIFKIQISIKQSSKSEIFCSASMSKPTMKKPMKGSYATLSCVVGITQVK